MTFDAGAAFMDILPRADGFAAELRKELEPALSSLEDEASSAGKGIGNALSVGLIAAGTVAATAIGKAISATQQWGSDVRSLQKVTGLAAEEASVLAATGDLLGVSIDKLSTGIGAFDLKLVNGAANLEKYGITTSDAAGNLLPFEQLLGNTSERFLELETAPEQAAFAVNVFGKAGRDMIPILKLGADGLAQMRDRAEELGLVMDQDALDATRELSLAQRELDAALKGAGVSLGQVFVPILTKGVTVLTGFVELIHDIPQPVLAGGLAITVLTGAVAAGLKVYGFFTDTWRNLLDTIGTGVDTIEAGTVAVDTLTTAGGATINTAALQAQTLATGELTVALQGLSLGLGVEVPASAVRAAGSLAGFGATESGLLVPTHALTAALAEQAAAATAAGTAGAAGAAGVGAGATAVVGLSAVAVPAVAVLATLAGVLKLAGDAAADTELEIEGIVKQVQEGVRTLPQLQEEIAKIRAGEGTLTPEGNFVEFVRNPVIEGPNLGAAKGADTNAAILEEATKRVQEAQSLLAQSTEEVSVGLRREFEGVTDLTQTLDQLGISTDRFDVLLNRTSESLDHFADVSGVDASSILADISKVVNDPKSTIEDVLAAYQAGIAGVKAAYQDWHDAIVDNFGGAAAALDEFTGKQHVNFDALGDSLDDQRRDLRDWQADFDTILKGGGAAAKTFLNDMKEDGLDSLGILDSVADEPKKIRNEFLANYASVDKQTDSLASGIQKALGKAFRDVIFELRNVVRAIQGLPPLELDASKAFGTLRQLRAQLAALEGQHTISVDFRGGGGHALAGGGIIRGASGFVTQEPTFLVGEGSNPTPFGRGAEAVLPLDDMTLKRLAGAMAAQGGSSRPAGGDVHDLAREVGRAVADGLRNARISFDSDGAARIVTDRQARRERLAGRRP